MKSGRTAYLNGLAAEAIAERIYTSDGGHVLQRRWRCPAGEIDLVIGLGGTIVFVEVKARRTGPSAADSLRPAQMRRLWAAATYYLATHGGENQDARIDVVLVDRAGVAERLENAVTPDAF